MIHYNIMLDAHKGGYQATLEGIKTGDAGARCLSIKLSDGGAAFVFPESAIVTLWAEKSNGARVFASCSVENARIVCPLEGSLCDTAGEVKCECRIVSEGKLLTSPRFRLIVEDALQQDGAIEAEDSFTALTDALSRVLEAESGLDSKVDKVEGTSGNAVIFGEDGAIADSGIAPIETFTFNYEESGAADVHNKKQFEGLKACFGAGIKFILQMDTGNHTIPAFFKHSGANWQIYCVDHIYNIRYYIYASRSFTYTKEYIYQFTAFDDEEGKPASQKATAVWVKEQVAAATPVLGEDYFTPEDKATIVSDVLAALPKWEGGEY